MNYALMDYEDDCVDYCDDVLEALPRVAQLMATTG